jgi:DNA modification methylase
VIEGDCAIAVSDLEAETIDAIVTDPPYRIGFQGERWDGPAIREAAARSAGRRTSAGEAYQSWCRGWAAECLRTLKPGAHLTAFGSPRTAHRLASALEEAGFELRDTLIWLYGTGLPKSRRLPCGRATSLKPAYEPILLARRPPEGPIERNLEAHGTGALNADACRVEGRFPANVLVSHAPGCRSDECSADCPVRLVDDAAGSTRAPSGRLRAASRLFYCPKASRSERDAGCEHLPRRALELFPNAQADSYKPPPAANTHPTVKPLALMRWLMRLVVPPGGLALDPFCGSGSTGCAAVLEGRRFLGVELDPRYAEIARARIAHSGGPRSPLAARGRALRRPPEQARRGAKVAEGLRGDEARSGRHRGDRSPRRGADRRCPAAGAAGGALRRRGRGRAGARHRARLGLRPWPRARRGAPGRPAGSAAVRSEGGLPPACRAPGASPSGFGRRLSRPPWAGREIDWSRAPNGANVVEPAGEGRPRTPTPEERS